MVFVRTQGCNLWDTHGGCQWCDTMYAQDSSQGQEWSVEAIADRLSRYPSKRLCLTGGEPLCQPEIGNLLMILRERGYWIEMETNGSMSIKKLLAHVDSWIVDVKCPSSGMMSHNYLDNLRILRQRDQVKFVVMDESDIKYAQLILRERPTKAAILFSSVSGDPSWLQELVAHVKRMPQARLSLQIHKFIWGDSRYECSDYTLRRTGFGHGRGSGQKSGI